MNTIHLPNADVRLDETFIPYGDATALYDRLARDLPWEQRDVTVQGRVFQQPRLTSWHGDAGSYTYSGLTLEAKPWTEDLIAIRDRLEAELGIRFNSVLANLYRAGRRDSIGMHSDSERELGRFPTIASISLGRERAFILAPKKGREGSRTALRLPHGSLLVMAGATQDNWLHGVDKEAAPSPEGRINLTFRTIRR